MAFNQASFFLFAPGFSPAVEFDHTANTASGEAIALISACQTEPSTPKVPTEELRRWLLARGFAEKERYGGLQILYRGRHATFLGTQEEIVLSLALDEEEVQELYLRFLLTEQTPEQLAVWKEFVVELGYDFGFQIMGEGHELLPCLDFNTVLAQNWNFRTFQKIHRWQL